MLRLDANAAAFDPIEQPVLVARQAEEPVAFDDRLRRLAVLGAASVGEVAGQDERFAAGAVEALVVTLVEVAGVRARTPQALDTGRWRRSVLVLMKSSFES
jgi:hypothetical protein